ncbi:hypothetical protein EP7_005210 [Isosphaeraceae bacterium EP7]
MRLIIVLLAAVVAGPWSLVDLALDSIAGRAADSDPTIATQASFEAGSPIRPRIRRPPPMAHGWQIEPQAIVAEQDEADDLAQDATDGWWTSPRADRPSLQGCHVGLTPTVNSDGRRIPRVPTRVPLRC